MPSTTPTLSPASFTVGSPLTCEGIHEDNPRDFLAALGLFRLFLQCFPDASIKMAWNSQGNPVYTTDLDLPSSYAEELACWVRQYNEASPHPFAYGSVIKTTPEKFRGILLAALEGNNPSAPFTTELLAAFASQVHLQNKEEISVSALSFSNGQSGKNLLLDVCQLIEGNFSANSLTAALQGISAMKESVKSLRWDPVENRAAAYRAADPGANVKGDDILSFPALNVLAFFGLTFYPVVDRETSEFTAGVSRQSITQRSTTERPQTYFIWPIWTCPLGKNSLFSLLTCSALHQSPPDYTTLKVRGCQKLWRSRRYSSEKSLYFAPAEPA